MAEWFTNELRCGVLEPTPDPGLPEEEEALRRAGEGERGCAQAQVVAATPEGDDGTVTPIPMPESVGVGTGDAPLGD